MKYYVDEAAGPFTARIVGEEEAARINATEDGLAEEVKSFQVRFVAVDGEFSKTAYTPERVLACIKEHIGSLEADGMVSDDGIVRFSGVLVTRRVLDRKSDRKIEVSLRSLKADWMKEVA